MERQIYLHRRRESQTNSSWVDGSPGLKEPLPLFPDSQRGVADSPGTP